MNNKGIEFLPQIPDFTIAISLQTDDVSLRYFKLSFFDLKWFIDWNIYKVSDIEMQRYKDKKIRVCDKNSIPFQFSVLCFCIWDIDLSNPDHVN